MRRSIVLLTLVAVAVMSCAAPGADAKDLSKLSLDELMALHTDENASVDRQALEDALRKGLTTVPTPQLFLLRKEANAEGLLCVDFMYKPLTERMAANSLIVHGKVTKIEYNRDDLIRDILARAMGGTGMTIGVEVLGQYPREPHFDTLTYETSVSWEYTTFVREGYEYVFSFSLNDGKVTGGGVTASHIVQDGKVGFVIDHTPIALDEMWEIVESRYALVSTGEAGGEAIETWTRKLAEGDIGASRAALDILTQRPETTPAPAVVMDMLERHYNELREVFDKVPAFGNSSAEPERRGFRALAKKVADVLAQAGDAQASGRMYAMYVEDLSKHGQPVLGTDGNFDADMVRVVGAAPCPERIERLKTLFTGAGSIKHEQGTSSYRLVEWLYTAVKALEEAPGEEIDAFLLDMASNPTAYGLRTDLDLAAVHSVLAKRGVMAIRPTLERIMEDPAGHDAGLPPSSATNDAVGSRQIYAIEALAELANHLSREDTYALALKMAACGWQGAPLLVCKAAGDDPESAKPVLMQMDINDVASCITAGRFADPGFAPKLRAALDEKADPILVQALAACGDKETAARAAGAELKPAHAIEESQALFDYFNLGTRYASFLVFLPGSGPSDALKKLLDRKHIAYLEERCDTLLEKRAPANRHDNLNRWRQWVLAALVVCDPGAARPFLEDDLQSSDRDKRLFAAFALLAQGDERGLPTVEAYVSHKNGYQGTVPLTVVRSERTDRLLLDRLRAGVDYSDAGLLRLYCGYGEVAPSGFGVDYAKTLVPALLGFLDSDDPPTSQAARMCLGTILGVPYEPLPNPATKEQILQDRQRWHDRAKEYLGE